jgi:hypothetical protein
MYTWGGGIRDGGNGGGALGAGLRQSIGSDLSWEAGGREARAGEIEI